MNSFNRCASILLLGLIGILATSACSTSGRTSETSMPEEEPTVIAAGVQTMSLEAIAINGKSLGKRPKNHISASPGDIITAEIYVRDWSPDGELLFGYQAALLPLSFSSGTKGYIEPVDYEVTQENGKENLENSFIDDRHPRYVHLGLKTLSLPDTRSEGYRWMSVVLQGTGPKCAQDGKKFYGATIKFEVSKNAEGTFSLELNCHPDYSGLRKGDASPINGMHCEPLKVEIR